MIKITESAAKTIIASMQTAQLDIEKYAFYLYIANDELAITFTNKEVEQSILVHGLKVLIDPQVESFHKDNNLIIDYVVNNDKNKYGLIFIEEKYYDSNHG